MAGDTPSERTTGLLGVACTDAEVLRGDATTPAPVAVLGSTGMALHKLLQSFLCSSSYLSSAEMQFLQPYPSCSLPASTPLLTSLISDPKRCRWPCRSGLLSLDLLFLSSLLVRSFPQRKQLWHLSIATTLQDLCKASSSNYGINSPKKLRA